LSSTILGATVHGLNKLLTATDRIWGFHMHCHPDGYSRPVKITAILIRIYENRAREFALSPKMIFNNAISPETTK
jgi:hypothetical protein